LGTRQKLQKKKCKSNEAARQNKLQMLSDCEKIGGDLEIWQKRDNPN
jgi:hypothetical protein